MKRCEWCGRFVATGTNWTPGYNRWGTQVWQLLCPPDARSWLDLSAANLKRLAP